MNVILNTTYSGCHVTGNTVGSNNSSGMEIRTVCLTNNNGANGRASENDTLEVKHRKMETSCFHLTMFHFKLRQIAR